MANLSNRSGCPSCEGDGEDEDCEAHTMETGAEYEMKVLKGESSTSTNNDCHTKGQGQVQPRDPPSAKKTVVLL